ncbi:acyl carrier protein [Streptomyces boninensis]|uniref:acyl carrier protein n=1 Tax=Streptomyces boninensis TaxID=2039455 RepID=UPI003B21AD15
MIISVLGDYAPEGDAAITLDSRFGDDLEMESIDLVTLSGRLAEWYGPEANFAEYLASLELDEIIELTVGRLVSYVVRSLRTAAADATVIAAER